MHELNLIILFKKSHDLGQIAVLTAAHTSSSRRPIEPELGYHGAYFLILYVASLLQLCAPVCSSYFLLPGLAANSPRPTPHSHTGITRTNAIKGPPPPWSTQLGRCPQDDTNLQAPTNN